MVVVTVLLDPGSMWTEPSRRCHRGITDPGMPVKSSGVVCDGFRVIFVLVRR
jgi:hypothetical protein